MVEDGLMERFGIQEVYGLHNMPGCRWATSPSGPARCMAATDLFTIEIEAAAATRRGRTTASTRSSPASAIVLALQSIVARNVDPLEPAVVSVTTFNAGEPSTSSPSRRRSPARAPSSPRCRT